MSEATFGEWLKRRRNAVGLTQAPLAVQLNCSISALRKMEAELRRPSPEVVEQLAEVFNIPREERKAFLRYARGDWQAISSGDQEEAPWKASTVSPEKQVKTATSRNNLPLQLTSFIGREKEQQEIAQLIAKNRLVTLTGAGGIGKSRLSIRTAFSVLEEYPTGTWLVELAPLSDPLLVAQVIVNTLGLLEQANRAAQMVLTDFLREKKSLLILDNCEHLIQACAQLAETLLQACPDLHILATSREALGVSGEWIHNVTTLSIPDNQQSLTTAGLTEYEAVRLFLDRAQTVVHDFVLRPENALAITQICHHLDGIPLALELAAARLKGLSVEQIAARLDDRFHLLASGNRTAFPRHKTLQALIDWSHDLLTDSERALFRRLSIFAGGWTLEAAEQVCARDGLAASEILDLLLHLVDKSLVVAETQTAETRYHMLETIRQYAHDKLWAAGEGEITRQRHLAYFLDLAERAEPNLRAFGMIQWLDRLETEPDNIRVALELAQESDVEAQLRLASALLWFWHIRGHKNEGIEWLERGLSIEAAERGDQPLTPSRAMIRGKALNASGFLMAMFFDPKKAQGRFKESLVLFQERGSAGKRGAAYALWGLATAAPSPDNQRRNLVEQSLILFREVGDQFGAAECLMRLTSLAYEENDYQQSMLFAEEHLALRKEIGDRDGIATALLYLGDLVFFFQNDFQWAIALLDESVAIFRESRNNWARGLTLSSVGDICLWQGDYERATEIYEEALAFGQDLADRFFVAINVQGLGVIAWFKGDYTQATQKTQEGLSLFRDIGEDWWIAGSLHCLGDIALARGDDQSAVQWYEAELAFGQEAKLKTSLAFALCGLGKLAWVQGNNELATKRFEEGLRVGREADLRTATFHALYGLGRVTQSQVNYSAARAYYAEILGTQKQRISPPLWAMKTYGCAIAYPLEALGVLAAAQNQWERSTRLFGAAEILYPPLRFEMSARERIEHDQAVAAARAALGEEAFAAAWAEGKKMTMEQAVAYALEGEED